MSSMSHIAKLLTNRELCLRCTSLGAELDEDATQAALEALAASVLVIKAIALCRRCGALKQTFRMPTHY